jgi:hypothetical protein
VGLQRRVPLVRAATSQTAERPLPSMRPKVVSQVRSVVGYMGAETAEQNGTIQRRRRPLPNARDSLVPQRDRLTREKKKKDRPSRTMFFFFFLRKASTQMKSQEK